MASATPSWLGMAALAAGALVGALAWSRAGRGAVTNGLGRVNPGPVPPSGGAGPAGAGRHPLDPRSLESTCLRLAHTVVGRGYSYGGGTPRSPWPVGEPGVHGGVGWDCSGLSLAFSACLLRYPWEGRDLTAQGLGALCAPVALGAQKPGDLAIYRGQHVTVVLTGPQPGAGVHSRVLSASGGGRSTNGDDPAARVRIFDRADYRADWLTYMRLPPVEVGETQAVTCMALHTLLAGGVPGPDPRLPLPALRRELAARFGTVPAVQRWLAVPTA